MISGKRGLEGGRVPAMRAGAYTLRQRVCPFIRYPVAVLP
ncbi:hypothetical protein LIG30_4395 [Burkholderia sp. lig30]|jgi:hypothetical protein|nr:hypothetical protein LIG30_4395 [Burkholderia sp. lig30]